jgi:arylsulfatase A-like enzyme
MNTLKMNSILLKSIASISVLLFCSGEAVTAQIKQKKNVVIIMSDDFNYWNSTTKYYPEVKTPNLDELSKQGVHFADAQAAAPVCNPSRQALWSGLRPSTTGISGNASPWIRATAPFQNVVTMNQYFKDNGYYTHGWGKLYHSSFAESAATSDGQNWNAFSTSPIGGSKGNLNVYVNAKSPEVNWSVNASTMTTANCGDFGIATEAANLIAGYSTSVNQNKPFFLACGLSEPHLGWDVPKQFYDLFDRAKMTPPRGFLAGDLNDTAESQQDWYTEILADKKWEDAIHMYVSALYLTDYNAGVILNAVKNSIYNDNTIIVFMGDHGWHLGEKNRFGKATPWDMANKTTLIIYDPSYKNTNGTAKVCKKVVSLQDIYPTLIELSGLPIKTDIEGNSLAALVENPDKADWDKPVAVTRIFDRVRTNRWSYIDADGNSATTSSKDMLYDIENDPDELNNLLWSTQTRLPAQQVTAIRSRLVFQLDSIKNIGSDIKSKWIAKYKFTPKPLSIPGTIEAEDYDEGAYAHTYFDADKVNMGGQYRTADGTDIYTTNDFTGFFHLGGLSTGDWCNYTVKDFLKGGYKIDFRVRNPGSTPAVLQIFNRDALLVEVTVPASTTAWQTISAPQIVLAEQYSTRLKVKVKTGSGLEFNSMKFESVNLANTEITANISRKCLLSTIITNGVLYLDLSTSDIITSVSIYDVSGKLVDTSKILGEQMVTYTPATSLKAGVYFLRVLDDNVASVEKFIVK